MIKTELKLTAADVLALITSANAPSPRSALVARRALRKAVGLGEVAFVDQATFSTTQRILNNLPAIGSPKPSMQSPVQITPQQMRDARKLLKWSRERLAVLSDATASFILAYENNGQVTTMSSRETSFDGLAAIRVTLEAVGVIFTEGKKPGVKLKRVTR